MNLTMNQYVSKIKTSVGLKTAVKKRKVLVLLVLSGDRFTSHTDGVVPLEHSEVQWRFSAFAQGHLNKENTDLVRTSAKPRGGGLRMVQSSSDQRPQGHYSI